MLKEIFQASKGMRPTLPRTLVLLTDGPSQDDVMLPAKVAHVIGKATDAVMIQVLPPSLPPLKLAEGQITPLCGLPPLPGEREQISPLTKELLAAANWPLDQAAGISALLLCTLDSSGLSSHLSH